MDIYKTRISYPTATILCNLKTAMVFGLTASVSSWEVFRQAIKALTKVFANRPDLVIRHKKIIDMLKWEEIDPSAKLTPAFSCTINCGNIDDAGNRIHLPTCIYVDDALMLALDVDYMKMVLAAMIKAIFVVMRKPDVAVRQCPLAMNKWLELVIVAKHTMLGLIMQWYKDTPRRSITFSIRRFSPPANLSDLNNMTAILLNNMFWEEDIRRQRALLNNNFFAELC
jgi:hypothetical protein